MYINSDGVMLKIGDKTINLNTDGINYIEENTECEVKVNNKNEKAFKCIKCKMPRIKVMGMPKEIIVQGNTSVFKYANDKKVILHKAEDDDFNLEYAFLYAFFVYNSGVSKTEAARFLKSLTEDANE